MEFRGISINTNNVPRLADFYSRVLGVKAEGDDVHSVFNEFNLAIWNPGTIDNDEFNISERYFTLMFEVDDVDDEYERLKNSGIGVTFTSQPTTYPWGARAFGFKDPDGNNIDFLSPVK
jgi:predicted enzyme related to lactoylglutathione lyase